MFVLFLIQKIIIISIST